MRNGYASQPAADVVRANQARNWFNVSGTGTSGIIDTGVTRTIRRWSQSLFRDTILRETRQALRRRSRI